MLRINDKLYKYSVGSGFMQYEVFEVRQQEKNILYAIKCLNCKDHPNCELLVVNPKEKKQDYYEYVCMLNNNDDGQREEYYWHTNFENHNYYDSRDKAIMAEYRNSINYYEKEISNKEVSIKNYKDKITEANVLIKNILEKVSEGDNE